MLIRAHVATIEQSERDYLLRLIEQPMVVVFTVDDEKRNHQKIHPDSESNHSSGFICADHG